MSLAYVRRQRINACTVVQHQSDLFSWKKYNNYTHMLCTSTLFRMSFAHEGKLFIQRYNFLTLLAVRLCFVMPQMSWEYFQHTFPPSLLSLFCCPFGDTGWAGLGLGYSLPTHTVFSQVGSLHSRIQHFPDVLSGTIRRIYLLEILGNL